jgi:DNA (cytosine-5)-methyltransferase 1
MSTGQASAEIGIGIGTTLNCNHEAPIVTAFHNRQDPCVSGDVSQPIGAKDNGLAVALPINTQIATRGEALGEGTGFGIGCETDPAFTLQANHSHGVFYNMAVRRLTPLECERLQGFPDGYTAITKADGPRYKALGNSMAVNVMSWIGQRIQLVGLFPN